MSLFAGKKIFLLGFLIVLLFAIPLTVFLTQKSQQITSQAAPTTTLAFTPTTKNVNVGETASFDIMMNPGSNQVSFVKLTVTYDATKFAVDPTSGFVPNSSAFGAPLQGPTYGSGNVSVTLSVGSDPARVIATTTKIATITLKAIAGTNGLTTPIAVDVAQTQILSVGGGDQANENVLAGQPAPATVTIGGSAGAGSSSTTGAPVCSTLVLDRSSTGAAPYSVTFTATGKDDDGTISKVKFTFGDGQTSEITQSGGIGTNSVNAQIAHTYNNAGTYNASAVLTDNQNNTSSTTTCTLSITVTGVSSGGTGGSSIGGGSSGSGSAVVIPTSTPTSIPTLTITATPTIEPTGPGDQIIGIGTAGIILSLLGGLLLLGF